MNRLVSTLLAALLAGAALGTQAQAQALSNGDFSAGLDGWQTLGDASAQPASAGGQQLWLGTASLEYEDDFPLPAGARNSSGIAAAAAGSAGGVESFAGLTLGALDLGAGLEAYEGSAARQSFSAAAGDTLSFRWNFGTTDNLADYAFVVIDGSFTRLGGVAEATLPGDAGNLLQTGEQGFSLSLGAGPHSIVFGVVDVGDFNLSSTFAVRQVLVTPVPEPGGLALMLVGLAALRRVRRATGR